MASSRLTPEIIRHMLMKGFTQNEIADAHDVTRQAVSDMKRKYGISVKTPRQIALESYPWKTGQKFNGAEPNRLMRNHAEYMATGGKGMSELKLRRLAWFYQHLKMNDFVVEFDPNIPPHDGVSSGGFAYRKRERSDGDLIIRVNEHTNLTDEGRMLWRYPPQFP